MRNQTAEPGLMARTADVVTDVARTGAEVTGDIAYGIGRVVDAVQEARRPGRVLDIVAGVVRQAPLTSLSVAFICGMYLVRRR